MRKNDFMNFDLLLDYDLKKKISSKKCNFGLFKTLLILYALYSK